MSASKIGDKVQVQPACFYYRRTVIGRVVYIHPSGRWATLEWVSDSGIKLHESFFAEDLK